MRISGPPLDRIDIQVEVPAVRYKELADQSADESSGAHVAEAIQYRSLDRSFH